MNEEKIYNHIKRRKQEIKERFLDNPQMFTFEESMFRLDELLILKELIDIATTGKSFYIDEISNICDYLQNKISDI